MSITRKKKEEIVNSLTEIGRDASAIVFADFLGLKTKDLNVLRKTVKSLDGNVRVIKKTLAQKGFMKMAPEGVLTRHGGIAAIWFSGEDVPALFKTAWQFSRTNKDFKILGGYALAFGGALDAERALMLAKVPPREVLLGQLLGMLNYPIRNFAVTVREIQRSKSQAE